MSEKSLIQDLKPLIHFETLGCRLNQDESEGAAYAFSREGFQIHMEAFTAKSSVDENIILSIINTCTVTSKAEQKARRIIRLVLEKAKNSLVIVTGCYAQLDGDFIKAIDKERILIVPGKNKYFLSQLPRLLIEKNIYSSQNKKIDCNKLQDCINQVFLEDNLSVEEKYFSLYTPIFEKHSRASLKIQDGCNNQCSFCRIHLARGKSVSLSVNEILSRVLSMEKLNIKEVVFTGVNLSQYSSIYNDKKFTFSDLLEFLIENTKNIKFRISSFYPQHIDEKLCKVLASDRVQDSFHLSIQSGSENILKQMRRPYKIDDVYKAIDLLRKAKKNPFISCDLIAGFPGETEEDFNKTVDLCNKVHFSWIHSFPYSPRPGTFAFSMLDQIPENLKSKRAKILTELAIQGKIDYIKSLDSGVFTAIVENSRSLRIGKSLNKIHAVTNNFLHVEIDLNEFKNIPAVGSEIKIQKLTLIEENIRTGKETDCFAELYPNNN